MSAGRTQNDDNVGHDVITRTEVHTNSIPPSTSSPLFASTMSSPNDSSYNSSPTTPRQNQRYPSCRSIGIQMPASLLSCCDSLGSCDSSAPISGTACCLQEMHRRRERTTEQSLRLTNEELAYFLQQAIDISLDDKNMFLDNEDLY